MLYAQGNSWKLGRFPARHESWHTVAPRICTTGDFKFRTHFGYVQLRTSIVDLEATANLALFIAGRFIGAEYRIDQEPAAWSLYRTLISEIFFQHGPAAVDNL